MANKSFDGDFDAKNQRSLTVNEVQQIVDMARAIATNVKSDTQVFLWDAKVTLADADSMNPAADIWWNGEAELWCIDFGVVN